MVDPTVTSQALSGFLSNLGFFGPAAVLGWWVIMTLRKDLTRERDEARADLAKAQARNDLLADRVITLASSVERTMAELAAAIREGRKTP
jgi:hypothetical protein